MTPTQRTLKYLRAEGWKCQIVERWIPQARKRVDLFGIIDIVALKPYCIMGVQTTSASNHASHVTKALESDGLEDWLNARGRFLIISWGKKGKRGEKKVWTHRRQELTKEDLQDA